MPDSSTIELFLVDGTGDGLATAGEKTWCGRAIRLPYTRLPGYTPLDPRDSIECPGVYILVCPDCGGREARRRVCRRGAQLQTGARPA